jgi:hypothetical protein
LLHLIIGDRGDASLGSSTTPPPLDELSLLFRLALGDELNEADEQAESAEKKAESSSSNENVEVP